MPELTDSFLGKLLCRGSPMAWGQRETPVWCIFRGIILTVSSILQRQRSWVMRNSARLYLQNSTNTAQGQQPRSTRCQGEDSGHTCSSTAPRGSGTPGQPWMLKAVEWPKYSPHCLSSKVWVQVSLKGSSYLAPDPLESVIRSQRLLGLGLISPLPNRRG